MADQKMIAEAIRAWKELGFTINEVFGQGIVDTKPLENVISSNDENKLARFIHAVKESTVIFRNAK